MIRRVTIKNWRAYSHADIPFGFGTTFVVSKNGIGKSSLLEATRWAVTGQIHAKLEDVIRKGADEAQVEVELDISSDDVLKITRRLVSGREKLEIGVQGSLNGRTLSDQELVAFMEEKWDAGLSFVSQVAFLTEHLRREEEPNLIHQLARAFGLQNLQTARDDLAKPIADLAAHLKKSRAGVSARRRDLEDLETQIESIKQDESRAEAKVAATRELITKHEAVAKEREALERAIQEVQEWDRSMNALAEEAEQFVGRVEPTALPGTLEAAEKSLAEKQQALRIDRATIDGRIEALESSLGKLAEAEGLCPVCRRPLTAEDSSHAERSHQADLRELRTRRDQLGSATLDQELQALRGLLRRALVAGPRLSEPDADKLSQLSEGVVSGPGPADQLENSLRSLQHSQTSRAALEGRAIALRKELTAQDALEAQYRELALMETAQSTIDSVTERFLQESIFPLADVIRRRWKQLFADRPDLVIEPSGSLSRIINGQPLPLEAFSAGEQMYARLLLRLVTLTATTKASFCWIDEPLEHLDPTSRRVTAGLLARGGPSEGLKQIVVTTYEEELARKLSRSIDNVHLKYVRAEPPE